MQDSSLATSVTPILKWPELGVCRVPFQVFTDQALYDLEQDRLFRGDVWHWIGLEAETPNCGDFKANTIGDTPVFMIRDLQGAMKVFVNRCAHRGARLCIDNCGNTKGLTCVYHNWSYDLDGNLLGVAFRHGVNQQGGLPPDFDFTEHHLQRLRVDVMAGMVFATFSETVAPLRDWQSPGPAGGQDGLPSLAYPRRPARLYGPPTHLPAGNTVCHKRFPTLFKVSGLCVNKDNLCRQPG
jgi:phenylpropionate dioxygenase-like ring-hydroxylating dioxygenase large terminal subunit